MGDDRGSPLQNVNRWEMSFVPDYRQKTGICSNNNQCLLNIARKCGWMIGWMN